MSFSELAPSNTERVGLLRRFGGVAHEASSSGLTARAAPVPASGVASGAERLLGLNVRAGRVLARVVGLGGVSSVRTLPAGFAVEESFELHLR